MNQRSHPARLPIKELLDDCSIKRTRGSGPGGQHRNKVETAIVITHRPTGVTGQASEKRSQLQNREAAIERLRINLALAIRSPSSGIGEVVTGEPSERWMSRVISKKISVNPKHEDFPALLAEALDRLAECQFDVTQSANRLAISTSQLIKFLKSCPAAFEYVNRQRIELRLKRLS